jgi:hypothetical protein
VTDINAGLTRKCQATSSQPLGHFPPPLHGQMPQHNATTQSNITQHSRPHPPTVWAWWRNTYTCPGHVVHTQPSHWTAQTRLDTFLLLWFIFVGYVHTLACPCRMERSHFTYTTSQHDITSCTSTLHMTNNSSSGLHNDLGWLKPCCHSSRNHCRCCLV